MTDWDKAAKVINDGGIVVLPTDTIYGIVTSAFNQTTIKKIHGLKERSPYKPFIILVSKVEQLADLRIDKSLWSLSQDYWPGTNSLIFPLIGHFEYLTCGLKSLAVRLPDYKPLTDLISVTGPLVAPSANLESSPPAKNILEAKKYFKDNVDFYLDGGDLDHYPSKLIDIQTGKRLR